MYNFEDGNPRYIVSIDNHEELMRALTDFCKLMNIYCGHLLSARINGACELLVDKFGDTKVGRKFDEETGLYLYDF